MKINVTQSSMPKFDEYCEEIKSIWDNHCLTNSGPKHKMLEEKLAEFLNVKNICLFANGHLALEEAIRFYNFPEGSEIITTPFTFVSTCNAIVRNGLVPIFCDINLDDYTIDASKIEKLITKKTVAILPVHVYGNVCNVEKINEIAKKHNLKVIYDAAHAFGVKYKEKGICNFGDVSMISFHATKVFNTIEGGCLCSPSKDLIEKSNISKNFGLNFEDCVAFGGNLKMNEFSASMGLCNLRHIDCAIQKRRKIFEQYFKNLSNVCGIKLCKSQRNVKNNYAYFPVLFDGYKYNRDEVKKLLEKNDIGSRKYFYPCINDFSCYAMFNKNDTPNAKFASNHVLCLPIYEELSLELVNKICEIILE